jgi:hypothetical protein
MLTLDGRTYEPIDLDLVITKGEDWTIGLDWVDTNGAPVPAAGLSMVLRLERSLFGGVYPNDLTSDPDGGITLSDGRVQLTLDHDQTDALDFYSTRCWIELTNAADQVGTWSEGRMRLRRKGQR